MIYILISHTLGWGASWCMCPDWPPDKKLITGAKQPQDVQAVLTCKSICDVCHFNNIPYQVNIQNAMWIIESAWIVNQMYFRFGLFWSCLVVWSNSFVVERSHWRWQSVSNSFSCQHQHFDICWFWNLTLRCTAHEKYCESWHYRLTSESFDQSKLWNKFFTRFSEWGHLSDIPSAKTLFPASKVTVFTISSKNIGN